MQFSYDLLVGLILANSVCGFVDITRVHVGDKVYTERTEQPWFRTPHHEHHRVDPENIEESGFGQHFIPEDDVFVNPEWMKEEKKFLPCMDRLCLCRFFNGTVRDQRCHLNDTMQLRKAHRQEIRTLSDEKRKMWEDTLNAMKRSGQYNQLMRVHKYAGVHSGPGFVIWHREFLKRLEIVVRRQLTDVNMGVPYWDSSLDALLPTPKDSIMFSELFFGEVDDNGYVKNGPYYNWTTMEVGDLFFKFKTTMAAYFWGRAQIFRDFDSDSSGELLNNARIDWIINSPNLDHVIGTTMPLETCPMNHTLDPRMLEYSHDYVHFFVSGDLGRSYSSSNDVIFIYHHSMIDWTFETWRQNMQTRTQRERDYPHSDERCFPAWHFAEKPMPMLDPFLNRDALSNAYTDELYEFASRPNCSRENQDCGSKYLFCFIPKSEAEAPYCMSKVRMGGDCTGLEKYPVCYRGICRETARVESRCHPIPEEHQENPTKTKESEKLKKPKKFNPLKEHLPKKNKLPEAM